MTRKIYKSSAISDTETAEPMSDHPSPSPASARGANPEAVRIELRYAAHLADDYRDGGEIAAAREIATRLASVLGLTVSASPSGEPVSPADELPSSPSAPTTDEYAEPLVPLDGADWKHSTRDGILRVGKIVARTEQWATAIKRLLADEEPWKSASSLPPSASGETTDETAWVIVRGDASSLHYYMGGDSAARYPWSKNHLDARRYSSEADANAALARGLNDDFRRGQFMPDARVEEHVWLAASPPVRSEDDAPDAEHLARCMEVLANEFAEGRWIDADLAEAQRWPGTAGPLAWEHNLRDAAKLLDLAARSSSRESGETDAVKDATHLRYADSTTWEMIDDAIERFATARHRATLAGGDVCPRDREVAVELIAANKALRDLIVRVFDGYRAIGQLYLEAATCGSGHRRIAELEARLTTRSAALSAKDAELATFRAATMDMSLALGTLGTVIAPEQDWDGDGRSRAQQIQDLLAAARRLVAAKEDGNG